MNLVFNNLDMIFTIIINIYYNIYCTYKYFFNIDTKQLFNFAYQC